MTEKTLTTENIKPALDALRGELAPWPVVAMKQDRLNDTQKSAVNSGITSSLVAQIIANTAAIRALESAITGTGLRPIVVASLPAIGTRGILYIVPVTTYDPETDADVVNYSNEYIWIVAPDAPVTEGYYEQVGQTGIVINNGQLNITVNGTSVGTFTANQSGDTTAAITVPTNADYVDLSTSQTVTGGKTWTGEQSFTLPIVGSITGTASKAIADEDGTSIKTGYGKLAGNQMWTGNNTFSQTITETNGRIYRSVSNLTRGTNPASTVYYGILNDYDSTGSTLCNQYRGYVSSAGSNYYEQNLSSWDGNSTLTLQLYLSADGATKNYNIGANTLPSSNSTYSLGTSSLRWSAVYSDSYYYGTTAWGLDKANVWTGANTFSKDNLDTQTVYTLGTLPQAEDAQALLRGRTTDSNFVTGIYFYQSPIKGTGLRLTIRNKWDSNGYSTTGTTRNAHLEFLQSADRTAYIQWQGCVNNDLYPLANNTYDLGTSTNKWKSLNGTNPGALGIPDKDNMVNIASEFTDLTGGFNYYIPPADGFVSINADTDVYCAVVSSTHNTAFWRQSAVATSTGYASVTIPVRAGLHLQAKINSTVAIYAAFYPCLGNV